jgi:transposase
MSVYQSFIGIDIGKFTFVVNLYGSHTTQEFDNSPRGIQTFERHFKKELPKALVILETTGGYERSLLHTLCDHAVAVHRAHTRKVKNFIRSFGIQAKTDALDAKALALYGFERQGRLDLFQPCSPVLSALYELAQRRQDLKQMRVAEKNRLQAPNGLEIKKSCHDIIQALTHQIDLFSEKINHLIKTHPALKGRYDTLLTIPGIGPLTAQNLLALMPELGTLTKKQAASLAGLAPRANESGSFKGYRRTGKGRVGLKPLLFLSAMAARNSHSPLAEFYQRLISQGKKKMVALTALMRKLVVIANAKLKSFPLLETELQHS